MSYFKSHIMLRELLDSKMKNMNSSEKKFEEDLNAFCKLQERLRKAIGELDLEEKAYMTFHLNEMVLKWPSKVFVQSLEITSGEIKENKTDTCEAIAVKKLFPIDVDVEEVLNSLKQNKEKYTPLVEKLQAVVASCSSIFIERSKKNIESSFALPELSEFEQNELLEIGDVALNLKSDVEQELGKELKYPVVSKQSDTATSLFTNWNDVSVYSFVNSDIGTELCHLNLDCQKLEETKPHDPGNIL